MLYISLTAVVEIFRGQVKFSTFLNPNEQTERICLYLVRQVDAMPSKIRHFQISKSIFEAKYKTIILKPKFLFEYQIRRTTFIKSIYFFNHCCKILFSKNMPYFCRVSTKLVCQISKNPLTMLNWM